MKNKNLSLISEKRLSIDTEKRIITHYISSEAVNCYGYILANAGMDDTNFIKNPVVLYGHNKSEGGGFFSDGIMMRPSATIIAKSLKRFIVDNKLAAETQFYTTELAKEVFQFNADGLLNSWSVSWDFIGDDPDEYIEDRKINNSTYPMVMKWMLNEYSSVIIPGNPDAVNQMMKLAKTFPMKNSLIRELAIIKTKDEIDNNTRLLTEIKNEIQSLKTDKLSKEDIEKQQTEKEKELNIYIDTKIQSLTLSTAENFLTVTARMTNIERNINENILKGIPVIVSNAIRKELGRVD